MKYILELTGGFAKSKWAFKVALSYLLLLLLVVIALPVLPLPFAPNYLDLQHPYLPPFTAAALEAGHLLGTDGLGRDLLANLLYGARTAFLISFPVMLAATFFGLVLGTSAGYLGNKGLARQRSTILCICLGLLAFLFYGVFLPLQSLRMQLGLAHVIYPYLSLLALLLFFWLFSKALAKWFLFWRKPAAIPADQLILRLTEALGSVPRFVLILALASFIPPSTVLLSLLLVLTLWPASARLARAEMLRIKHLPYFEAARSIGNGPYSLLWRHALPNLAGPVLVAFTFGLGGLLTLESTLSFLNIGVPTTLVSWGRTISSIRSNTSAWWLVVLPGGFLSLTVLALYTCSHYLAQIFGSKRG